MSLVNRLARTGVAVARLRYDIRAVAGLILIIVVVAALAATAPTLADALGEAGLVRKVDQAPARERAIRVTGRAELADAERLDAIVREAFAPMSEMSTPARLLTSNAYAVDVVADANPVASLGWWEGPVDLLGPIDGRLPAAPGETAVHQAMASQLGLSLGSVLELRREGSSLKLTVVGMFDPVPDLVDLEPQLGEGVTRTGSFIEFGPLLVSGDTLASTTGRVTASWVSLPVTRNIRADEIAGWRNAVAGMGRKVAPLSVESGLNQLLAGSVVGVRAASVTIAAIFGLVTLLSMIGLATAALAAIERRRIELELTRSRGAGAGQLFADAALEGALFAVLAVGIAPLVAVVAVSAGGESGLLGGLGDAMRPRLSGGAFGLAAVAGAACVAILALPIVSNRGGFAMARAERSRNEAQGLIRRSGLDLILAGLGLLALWRLRQGWTPRAGVVDPMVWAAPILVWLAGIVVLGRVIPPVLGLIEGRASSADLGWNLPATWAARAPGRSIRHAILVASATAILLLVSVYGATWWRSQLDQARLEVGAAAAGGRDAPGGSPVRIHTVSVGARVSGVRLVALETGRFEVRSDLVVPPGAWAMLAAGSGIEEPGFALGSGPLTATVKVVATTPVSSPVVRLAPVTMDDDGVVAPGDEVQIETGAERTVTWNPPGPGPWRLLGFRLAVAGVQPDDPGAQPSMTHEVAIQVAGVRMAGSSWQASALASPLARAAASADPANEGVVVSVGSVAAGAQLGVVSEVRVVARDHPPLPALVTPGLLAQTGLAVGDEVAMTVGASTPTLVIVGTIAALPTDPARPLGVVVDYSSLAALEWEQGTDYGSPDLRLFDDPASPGVTVTAEQARRQRLADPVSVAVLGALGFGALAVTVVTIVGLAYGVGVAIEGRRFELALLRALGVPPGDVRKMLRRESLLVAVLGTIGGLLIGGVLAVVTIASLARDVDGNPILPAPRLVVPWWAAVGALALGVLSMLVASRSATGAVDSPGAIIRAGEER